MKKILRTVFVFLLFQTGLFAQKITMKEHYKYWYYRHRLLEEFVITGEAPSLCTPSGLSIPALHADQWGNKKLSLCWTDNPAAGLGYWIGILATELKLLYLYNQPYVNTQQELYYAMKAYERLDYNCECLFPFPLPPVPLSNGELNGFFCRDDVPGNFMSDNGGHRAFRDANNYDSTVSSIYTKFLKYVKDSSESQYKRTYYPSGEEVKGMLTGFSMVVTALADCPAEVVIYNNYRFIDQAILHTQRNFDYVRADGWEGRLTNDTLYRYGANLLRELNGYGLAKAADFICDSSRDYAVPLTIDPYRHYGEDFPYNNPVWDVFWSILGGLPWTAGNVIIKLLDGTTSNDLLMDYQKWGWMIRGNPNSHFLGETGIGKQINDFSLWSDPIDLNLGVVHLGIIDTGNVQYAASAMAFAAIGDSWKDVDNNFNNITFESLVNYIDGAHWEYYPLLNLYLHNKVKSADTIRSNMVNYLISAPCQGPHYLPFIPAPDSGVLGWRSGFRWTDISPNGWDIDIPEKPEGSKFPGLDYMLAYNLLWLECLQKGILSTYFDPTVYANGRDYDYNVYNGSQADTYFKYGDMIYTPFLGGSVKFNTKNVNFVGESIDISGDVEFSTGYTFNLVTYPKLNSCDLENYFGP